MKKSLLTFVALGLIVGLVGTGCKKTTPGVTNLPSSGPVGSGNAGKGTGAGAGGTSTSGPEVLPPVQPPGDNVSGTQIQMPPPADGSQPDRTGLDGMIPNRDAFKANTVYFEFDRANVKKGEVSKIDEVVKALKAEPKNKIQIEGHCDERGTEEYNRALGDRRALALREYMVQAGVDGSRVFTITFGKDRPVETAHNEAAWSKNRRGEFILYTPKAQ